MNKLTVDSVVLDGTSITDGTATFENAVDLIEAVPGNSTSAIVPAITGEYILKFQDDLLLKLKLLTKKTLDEEAATLMNEKNNPRFKQVYDAYESFRSNYSNWNKLSDEAYQKSLELKWEIIFNV